MRTGFRALCGCTAALTDTALLFLLMLTASLGGNRGQAAISLPLWLLCGIAAVLLNLLLFRRGFPVPVLAAVNGGLYAAGLALLLMTAPVLEGVWGWLLAVGLTAIAAGRAVYHAWTVPALQTQLTRIDLVLAGLFWALLLQAGPGAARPLLWLLPVLLILNIVIAVALRAGAEDGQGGLLVGAPLRGGLFAAALAALLTALALWLTRIFGVGAQTAASALFQAVKGGWLALWGGIERFFNWLFGLLPADLPAESISAPAAESAASTPDLSGVEMQSLLPVFAVILTAAVLAVLILLIIRFRRLTLRRVPRTAARSGGAVRRIRRPGLFRRRWAALLARLRFQLLALRYAGTPAGLLVRLERWGRRHKLPRGEGEPIRAYLLRLDGTGGLAPLADALDAQFYGPGGGALSGTQCRALRSAFLRRKRREAHQKTGGSSKP